MKSIFILLFSVPAAIGQTGTASISGPLQDAKTRKPVPATLVMAVQSGLPPFSKNTKSGGDGAFQIQGLPPGKYTLCVQVPGDTVPVEWNPCHAHPGLRTDGDGRLVKTYSRVRSEHPGAGRAKDPEPED